MNEAILLTENEVKGILEKDASGHDWHHIDRVRKLALHIGRKEGINDLHIIELSALLHDVSDDKLQPSYMRGQELLESILDQLNLHQIDKSKIKSIIDSVSFKGGNQKPLSSIEAKIVRDADRLDAIGAIGIARTFAYGGSKGQSLYNPELSVRKNMTLEEYRNGESSSIHHFYEKLLTLKDSMCTNTGREIAEERHTYMEGFLKQFFNEWNGHQ
ncbi:HD domain-containing protein [Rossellomorea sp. BNER]|uniref:HD domain-containing protein n=1 Tax=Rossellomorea sp. BNER TaxID=2962031 RepID=UPI003AF30F49|nr:HD domain-containing protein [Rossellomorea sp. BNER]